MSAFLQQSRLADLPSGASGEPCMQQSTPNNNNVFSMNGDILYVFGFISISFICFLSLCFHFFSARRLEQQFVSVTSSLRWTICVLMLIRCYISILA